MWFPIIVIILFYMLNDLGFFLQDTWHKLYSFSADLFLLYYT